MNDLRNHQFWTKHTCNVYCEGEVHADLWYGYEKPLEGISRYITDENGNFALAEIVSIKKVNEAPVNVEKPWLTQALLIRFKHLTE